MLQRFSDRFDNYTKGVAVDAILAFLIACLTAELLNPIFG